MTAKGYKFTWKPMIQNANTTFQTVCAYDRESITMFLTQHGFDPNTAHIEIVYDEEEIEDGCLLHIHHFGSRNRDRLYDVMTCEEIMTYVITRVGDELNSTMELGACALRGEIELFGKISKLLEQLEYTFIQDPFAADASGYDSVDPKEYGNGYPYYESFAITKDEYVDALYEFLHTESHYSRPVQPITLESYVNIFTSGLLLGGH